MKKGDLQNFWGKLYGPAIVFILSGLLLVACSQDGPSLVPKVKIPVTKEPAPSPRAAWGERWESVLSEAKKEGTVTVYAIWGPKIRAALIQSFKDKYGINLEFTPFSRGSDLLVKVQAENRAGLYTADVFGAGNPTLLTTMRPAGVLGAVKPLLIIPEVLDPKAWHAGGVPFTDIEGQVVNLIGTIDRSVVYNINPVKEGDITSYKDLLKPQYKGNITFNDPSVTGAGNAVLTHLGRLWGEAEALDFFRRLIRDQDMVIQRDQRIHVESVARGKHTVGLAPMAEMVAEFGALGAPLKIALVKEDNRLSAASGVLGVPAKFAHPNAATVFVNWLLTKEGLSVFSRGFGNPSTRIDTSTEGFDPLLAPVPGEKYYSDTEDVLVARVKWLGLAKGVMGDNIK